MPISLRSWRKPLVERVLSRISVSLCCTSGWSTTVTPCMFFLFLSLSPPSGRLCPSSTGFGAREANSEYRAVADDRNRRAGVGPLVARKQPSGRPGAALKHARQREFIDSQTAPLADQHGDLVEQRNGERAPFDHERRVDRIGVDRSFRIAQPQHACVHEQSAIA